MNTARSHVDTVGTSGRLYGTVPGYNGLCVIHSVCHYLPELEVATVGLTAVCNVSDKRLFGGGGGDVVADFKSCRFRRLSVTSRRIHERFHKAPVGIVRVSSLYVRASVWSPACNVSFLVRCYVWYCNIYWRFILVKAW